MQVTEYIMQQEKGLGRVGEMGERRHRDDVAAVTDPEEEKIAKRHMHHNLEERGRRTLC